MGNLRPIRAPQLIRAIEKLGFLQIRQHGSHCIFKHPDGRWATIPLHSGRDLSKGFVHKILVDAELTWQDIEEHL